MIGQLILKIKFLESGRENNLKAVCFIFSSDKKVIRITIEKKDSRNFEESR